ncbi:hypothetical protein NRB_05120 [Novosphingobium sp. 11B]
MLELAQFLEISPESVLREVLNFEYQVVKINANEGNEDHTLNFDAAIDLLQNGMKLIDSSATVSITGDFVPIIRGRRPDAVKKYLDRVRVGQTEVGSFVLTLLMPIGVDPNELGLEQSQNAGIGSAIAQNFSNALRAAESVASNITSMEDRALIGNGITANFMQGLSRMIEVVDSLKIGIVAVRPDKKRPRYSKEVRFTHDSLELLKTVERRLTPAHEKSIVTVSGVITQLIEHKKRHSGNVVIEAEVYGAFHSIRVPFDKDNRDILFDAFHRKDMLEVVVSGSISDNNGKYRLDSPHGFQLRAKARLA